MDRVRSNLSSCSTAMRVLSQKAVQDGLLLHRMDVKTVLPLRWKTGFEVRDISYINTMAFSNFWKFLESFKAILKKAMNFLLPCCQRRWFPPTRFSSFKFNARKATKLNSFWNAFFFKLQGFLHKHTKGVLPPTLLSLILNQLVTLERLSSTCWGLS